jgi:REP element-mobilizing transposase RayT
MSDKFKNRYRIPSARLLNWDYSSNAAYIITICTADRKHYLGTIVNTKMKLSSIGEFAYKCWLETPNHFPHFYLEEFVVMPNHVHGILMI